MRRSLRVWEVCRCIPLMTPSRGLADGAWIGDLLPSRRKVDIVTPQEYTGDVMGDTNSRRGSIVELSDRMGMKSVKSLVPLANMFQVLFLAPCLSSRRLEKVWTSFLYFVVWLHRSVRGDGGRGSCSRYALPCGHVLDGDGDSLEHSDPRCMIAAPVSVCHRPLLFPQLSSGFPRTLVGPGPVRCLHDFSFPCDLISFLAPSTIVPASASCSVDSCVCFFRLSRSIVLSCFCAFALRCFGALVLWCVPAIPLYSRSFLVLSLYLCPCVDVLPPFPSSIVTCGSSALHEQYVSTLRSATKGRANYSIQLSKYDFVPPVRPCCVWEVGPLVDEVRARATMGCSVDSISKQCDPTRCHGGCGSGCKHERVIDGEESPRS